VTSSGTAAAAAENNRRVRFRGDPNNSTSAIEMKSAVPVTNKRKKASEGESTRVHIYNSTSISASPKTTASNPFDTVTANDSSDKIVGFTWSNNSCYLDSYFTMVYYLWKTFTRNDLDDFSNQFSSVSTSFQIWSLAGGHLLLHIVKSELEKIVYEKTSGITRGSYASISETIKSLQKVGCEFNILSTIEDFRSTNGSVLHRSRPYFTPAVVMEQYMYNIQDYVDEYYKEKKTRPTTFISPDCRYLHLVVDPPFDNNLTPFRCDEYFVDDELVIPGLHNCHHSFKLFGIIYQNQNHFCSRFYVENENNSSDCYHYDGMLNNNVRNYAVCTKVPRHPFFPFVIPETNYKINVLIYRKV
jgi:hypothetical protein